MTDPPSGHRPERPTRTQMFIGMATIAAAVFFFVLLVWVGIEGAMEAAGRPPKIIPGRPPTLP